MKLRNATIIGAAVIALLLVNPRGFAQETANNVAWKVDDSAKQGDKVFGDYVKAIEAIVDAKPMICKRSAALKLVINERGYKAVEIHILNPGDPRDGGQIFKVACPQKAAESKEEKDLADFQIKNTAEILVARISKTCD